MPIPPVAKFATTHFKSDAVRPLLELLSPAGANYDEALFRKYSDKTNGWYHGLAKHLMLFSTAVNIVFYLLGVAQSTPFRALIVAQAFYTGLFFYRMGEATDSDIESHFEFFPQKFFLYYPLIDERKDFTRRVNMVGRKELSKKGTQLEATIRVELFQSVCMMLAWTAWAMSIHHLVGENSLPLWKAFFVALFPTLMMAYNLGPMRFVDALQRFAFMSYVALPLKKISSIKHMSGYDSWATQGSLPKPAYNLHSSWCRPIASFMHKNVYSKLRSKEYKMTIGKSMAITALLRGAIFMSVYAFMELHDGSILAVGENTKLVTLTLMTIGYLTSAYLLWMYEDKPSFAKNMEYQRKPKAKEGVFFWHQVGTIVLDHVFFTTPLVYTAFQGTRTMN